MIAVLALTGTVAVGEYLAGAVIGVMLTGGRLLEQRAGRRAHQDLSALLSLAPRVAHRYEGQGIVTVEAADVRPGDLLLVRSGEVVPVDGLVECGRAVLDEATITGEPLPAEHGPDDEVRSGAVNSAGPNGSRQPGYRQAGAAEESVHHRERGWCSGPGPGHVSTPLKLARRTVNEALVEADRLKADRLMAVRDGEVVVDVEAESVAGRRTWVDRQQSQRHG